MVATGSTTASNILHHTSTFISEILSQSNHRKRLLTAVYGEISLFDEFALKSLGLATEALENAITADNSSIISSSLRCAEELILSLPENPYSYFLLTLIYGLDRQNLKSALSLLDLFISNPTLARSEIAPILFEELFLRHFLPIFHWFDEQRSEILTPPFPSNLIQENADGDESMVFPSTKSLSKMSIDQTLKLKEVESNYERVLDKNCRDFADHFKRILERRDDGGSIANPKIKLLDKKEKWKEMEEITEMKFRTEQLCLPNARYNPIWVEEDQIISLEVYSTTKSKSPPLPLPPPPSARSQILEPFNFISDQESSSRSRTFSIFNSTIQSHDDSSEILSLGSDTEIEENDHETTFFYSEEPKTKTQMLKQTITSLEESIVQSVELDFAMEDSGNASPGSSERHNTPSKDFVCPITCNIFYDPVTIETGQTYERSAIQEWLDRGNSTCPITGQKLQNTQLPRTNYVLKRLIATWLEENPNFVLEKALDEAESVPVLTSSVSVISQVSSIDSSLKEVRRAINSLCASEVMEEVETAVLCVERFWLEENVEGDVQDMLLKPSVINGLVEILVNSVNVQVLRAAIFLLSELGFKDDVVIQTLTRVESDVDCIATLFKRGVVEAVVLIYQLGLSSQTLQEMDMASSLLNVVKKKQDDVNKMRLSHKSVAVLLLRKILGRSKEGSLIVAAVLAENAIESILGSLKAKQVEERISAVGILLRCIQEDGKCRNIIADKADLASILTSLTEASKDEQLEIIMFLSELVKLNRRTLNEKILRNIKDGGECSTMHSLLIYLQTATRDQCPVVAGLLLQLDILVEPHKMSIYREEAIDVLISCLKDSDVPTAQISAAETIMSLEGRFSTSGRPYARHFLLERAGLTNRKPMRRDNFSSSLGEVEHMREEDKAADEWEKKMAFVLLNHDFGLLLEPLAKGLKSKHAALFSACFVSATWLCRMLRTLPDTGILEAARIFLLDHFLSIFTTTTAIEEKALGLLAINSFVHEPEGLQCISSNMRKIMRGLKELKKSTPLAFDMLKVLYEGQDSSTELWSHQELFQADCSRNGEVLSITYFKDNIISGHTDGTIKVWSVRGTNLHLQQEIQEHSKGVTSLAVSESEEKLFSGSLDKTIKVWALGSDTIQCIQVHDVKDQVHNLVVSKTVACFIPNGVGIRVFSWAGESKLLNSSKHVKCLNLVGAKLYCGCHDSSIQEVDLATGTLSYIHSGSRKLLGKANPIHAIQIHNEQLFSASTALDGAAVKIWSMSDSGVVGSLPTAMDVRTLAVGSNLTYLGGKGGVVEIWGSREKHNKIDTLQIGRNCKVICMTLNEREDILVIGTSDGRIQAWGL